MPAVLKKQYILQEVREIVLSEQVDYLRLSHTLNKYKDWLLELTELDLGREELRTDIHSVTGKAIGTTWAAMCVDDLIRTSSFIKGVLTAIEQVKQEKSGPVHILYAGTGPFAALVLPLLTTYTEEQIQLTLIEINEHSYATLLSVFDRLGFNKFVRAFLNTDATTFRMEPGERVDIILSETMQQALRAEQQVPIFMNLLPQISNKVYMIPENIVLSLGLLKYDSDVDTGIPQMCCQQIAEIFALNEKQIRQFAIARIEDQIDGLFPQYEFLISAEQMYGFHYLAIFTEIQVFRDIRITVNESGLTIPCCIAATQQQDILIKLQYRTGAEPGIACKIELSATNGLD